MFDAARAALLAANAPTPPEVAKTHSGLITAFSLHLVKTGRIPVEFGKALNRPKNRSLGLLTHLGMQRPRVQRRRIHR